MSFLNEGKRLNNATISILADKIVEIFQAEKRSTYFVSPIGKNRSRHNRPEVARGKLIDKHRNKLSMLKKILKGSEGSEIVKKKKVNLNYIILLPSYKKLFICLPCLSFQIYQKK